MGHWRFKEAGLRRYMEVREENDKKEVEGGQEVKGDSRRTITIGGNG